MKAVELISSRIAYTETAFAELVLWRLPKPLAGSPHGFKYRLAYVVRGKCVLRYDNEAGKGDPRHGDGKESAYVFTTPDQLIADFQNDIARWNHENLNA
ncbi:MAG: toxin-antitoxin system TumE family protein [Burkholderiales bacterium]